MSSDLRIQRVELHQREPLAELLDFPARIYAQDPAWVPPLRAWVMRRLDPDSPFFRDAELCFFGAWRQQASGGEALVGTISALRDKRHEQHRGEKAAFFGFFECIDDAEVAGALLDAAAHHAREQWGSEILRGPRNISRVEEVGITVQGHDFRPPLLASHHPPYYQALVEGQGFTKHHDVLAYHRMLVEPDGSPTPIPDKLRRRAEACEIPGLEVRRASYMHMERDLSLAHTVFVDAFRDVPENTPMPRDQFVHLGRAFLLFTKRELLQLATVDGRAAGFGLCVPELNEAVQQVGGKLLPLGWAKALVTIPRIKTASFKLIGVLPEYRGKGLNSKLILAVVQGLQEAGYHRVEGSLIDERNAASRGTVEGLGLEIYRRYRLYEREL